MNKAPKSFQIKIGDVDFHPQRYSSERLVTSLTGIRGLRYSFDCKGRNNSYQLNSSFDAAMNERLLAIGGRSFKFQPKCSTAIDFDFAVELNGEKCVFEVEKANKEKILYDFLKMHVYLDSDVAAAVLIAPINWPHSGGVENLFSLAKERFDLCRRHGMIDPSKCERMLIVGVTQIYQGNIIDDAANSQMKAECKVYFTRSHDS